MSLILWLIGVPVILWIIFCAVILIQYAVWGHKTDYSGDGGLAVIGIILMPFVPFIMAYDKVFGKKK